MFMTLLAGWQLLLSRYAGQEDVSVGTPIAGRTHLETEPLIGLFVNTLVLRTDLSAARTFRELLGEVRDVTLGAYQHQEVPFERLVEELAPERSLVQTPLFQVMFSLATLENGTPRLGEVKVEPLGSGGEAARFDLSLWTTQREDRIGGGLLYRTELFDDETIERMLRHLGILLEGVAARPDGRTGEVDLLSAAERAEVLEAWNDTAAAYGRGACLHEMFAEQAARTPGAVAVVDGSEEVAYAELDRRANYLAHRLRGRGVGPEARVGICLERSAELLVALLGTLKAGGAYVPLDPAHPSERLGYMLRDAGVRVLLTQGHLRERLPATQADLVCLDDDGRARPGSGDAPPACGVAPENVAYVIYTSGSTGRPKGVMVSHDSLANYLGWRAGRAGRGARHDPPAQPGDVRRFAEAAVPSAAARRRRVDPPRSRSRRPGQAAGCAGGPRARGGQLRPSLWRPS